LGLVVSIDSIVTSIRRGDGPAVSARTVSPVTTGWWDSTEYCASLKVAAVPGGNVAKV
jgi:hypothetical protein